MRAREMLQSSFRPSMEDDPAVVVNVSVDKTEDDADDLATGIQEEASNTEEAANANDELSTAAESMSNLIEALKDARKTGGLTPQSARFMRMSYESIVSPIGLQSSSRMLPAVESYDGQSARISNTTVSIEEAESTLGKIWQGIKNFFLKAWNYLKNFFAKLFGGYEALSKSSKDLLAKADKIGTKSAEGKIKTSAALVV